MDTTFYCTLIISENPVNLRVDQEARGLRHLVVNEKLTLMPGDQQKWEIEKSAPEHCDGHEASIRAAGKSVVGVIINWFNALCSSRNYVSQSRKNKGEKPFYM